MWKPVQPEIAFIWPVAISPMAGHLEAVYGCRRMDLVCVMPWWLDFVDKKNFKWPIDVNVTMEPPSGHTSLPLSFVSCVTPQRQFPLGSSLCLGDANGRYLSSVERLPGLETDLLSQHHDHQHIMKVR
jgi:hypothetical protein